MSLSESTTLLFGRASICGLLVYGPEKAIRYEEGAHIIRLWKHWAILFLGTNRKKYSAEAYNLLCNLLEVGTPFSNPLTKCSERLLVV